MNKLSKNQVCDVLEWFIESGKSPSITRRRVFTEFGVKLNEKSIARLYKQFRSRCFHREHLAARPMAGKPVSVTNNIMKNKVRASVICSPKKSLRRRSLSLEIPVSTLYKMLKNLKIKPYVVKRGHELKEGDYGERVKFCQWIVSEMDQDPEFLDKIFITDEAKFYMDGKVTSTHVRHWGLTPPDERNETPMDKRGVMVWCGMTSKFMIGPFFFEDNVSQVSYINLLKEKVFPEFERQNIDTSKIWFQQDGAPAHRAYRTLSVLEDKFEERIISKGADVDWPARSPDLSACDFFVWGFMKQLVYKKKPTSLEDLKRDITRCFEYISPDML